MAERRLVVLQPDGNPLYPEASRRLMKGERPGQFDLGPPASIDVSDIPNADTAAPFLLVVEERCNLERWHEIGRREVPCWSDDAWREAHK